MTTNVENFLANHIFEHEYGDYTYLAKDYLHLYVVFKDDEKWGAQYTKGGLEEHVKFDTIKDLSSRQEACEWCANHYAGAV